MLPIIHLFTAIVAGPTCCGKTGFVFRLIDNASSMISPPPAKTFYFYGEYQQLFNQYPHTKFHQGLPNIEDFDGKEPTLVIIDDLMQETNETVAHYMVLFKNPRDVSQFANLARQMYPQASHFAVEAYRDATREPYSYLLVDLRPEQDKELRLRTNIYPGETHYVYVPRV